MGETVPGGLYKVGDKYVDASGREVSPPAGMMVTPTGMVQVEMTAQGKVVLFNNETGERIERWPVIAKGMLANGEYSATPVGVRRNTGSNATDSYPDASRDSGTGIEALMPVVPSRVGASGREIQSRPEVPFPERITLDWIFRYVPVSMAAAAFGILVLVFLLGMAVGSGKSFSEILEILL